MIRLNCDDWASTVASLRSPVGKWYMATYPSDNLGKDIPVGLTFWDLVAAMNLGADVYCFLGDAADSLVRERIFGRIADIMGCDCDVVYNTWLGA